MSYENNSRIGEFTFRGKTIRLQASLRNLRKLGEVTGGSGLAYIMGTAVEVVDLESSMERVANILYALDVDAQAQSPEEVENWLFGNLLAFFEQEGKKLSELAEVISYIIGNEVAVKLAEVTPPEPDTKKKSKRADGGTSRVRQPDQSGNPAK